MSFDTPYLCRLPAHLDFMGCRDGTILEEPLIDAYEDGDDLFASVLQEFGFLKRNAAARRNASLVAAGLETSQPRGTRRTSPANSLELVEIP